MESLLFKIGENTNIIELIIILVLGLIFYFKLKDSFTIQIKELRHDTDQRFEKIESRFEKIESKQEEHFKILLARIDAVNSRLDNLYHEIFKKAA